MTAWNFAAAVVPVTGAASGIGLGICRRLRAEGATPLMLDVDGARLDAATRDVYADADTASRYGYVVDVTSSRAVDDCFSRIEQDHGRVTHAVANAGINKPTNILDVSDEDWHRIIDVNLHGLMYFCRASARCLSRANGGAIVTIASVAGLSAKQDRIAYCSSKAAIVNLTRAMALDLGRHRIRVNAVAPGIIDTPQQQMNSGAYHRAQAERAALGRNGTAEEIANVVLFLLSDLSSFVTGETIVADGGLTARYA
jgi:NAD(P)-dependent dehydrogenase (short-subunit alcohol dehydrogenase family)